MRETVFGNLILINIDFYDFIFTFSPWFYFRLRSNISNTKSNYYDLYLEKYQVHVASTDHFIVARNEGAQSIFK